MKHLTLLIAALLISFGAMAQNYEYDFASVCSSGQTLYYKILSSNPPQAEVVLGVALEEGGDLIIPEMAADTTNTFRLYEVISIADKAFEHFNTFSEKAGILVIPNTVLTIGEKSFHSSAFTNISLSESLVSVGDYAFYSVYELTGSLVIPQTVTSIGKHAFHACSISGCGFTGPLVIPYSVTSIGEKAFYGCGFTSLDWQAQLTEIPESCFYECQFSGTLTLPEGLTKIGKEAFAQCTSLTGLELPSTLNNIGNLAFGMCSGLTSIEIEALMPPYSPTTVFSFVDWDIPVHVPYGSKPLYEDNNAWRNFTNIIDDLDAVEEFENDGFEIYPNPAANAFRVTANDVEGRQAVLSVYNIVGQRMMMQKSTVNGRMVQFDVAETLPSGLYLIVLQTEETVRTGKLILNSH